MHQCCSGKLGTLLLELPSFCLKFPPSCVLGVKIFSPISWLRFQYEEWYLTSISVKLFGSNWRGIHFICTANVAAFQCWLKWPPFYLSITTTSVVTLHVHQVLWDPHSRSQILHSMSSWIPSNTLPLLCFAECLLVITCSWLTCAYRSSKGDFSLTTLLRGMEIYIPLWCSYKDQILGVNSASSVNIATAFQGGGIPTLLGEALPSV